jgi:hypothetical protein
VLNTLAYYRPDKVTIVISFILQVQGINLLKKLTLLN